IFKAKINVEKRDLTENNHSATHLLQAALRNVLGDHVAQKGSLVNENLLRFDFSHFAKMTDQELKQIEVLVNQKVRENIPLVEYRNIPIDQAKSMGAMALFGEKYGNFVRTIVFDPTYSVELCGGTHVKATGEIGLFKIVSESSVAAGVRRIEAITAKSAEQYINEQLTVLDSLRESLKNPKDLLKAVSDLQTEKSNLEKELERLQNKELQSLKNELISKIESINDIKLLAQKVEVPKAESLKTLAFQFRQQYEDLFLLLCAEIDGKAHLAVMVSDKLIESKGLDATKIIKDLAKHIEGGGGGQKFFATAAGKNVGGLQVVLSEGKNLI
ncbi:MAG: alanine--tRNA ligase, partial [Bacteroidetes bacterium]